MRALIIVDVQHDFLPGGALGIDGADAIIPEIEKLADTGNYQMIIASRDWHPQDHCSFIGSLLPNSDKWPAHCIADTHGAQLHPSIAALSPHIIDKGTEAHTDAYSAFANTKLSKLLVDNGIYEVDVCGLATDYCVKATVLDAGRNGFVPTLIQAASAAVNLDSQDEQRAISEMYDSGAYILTPVS